MVALAAHPRLAIADGLVECKYVVTVSEISRKFLLALVDLERQEDRTKTACITNPLKVNISLLS